MKIKKLITLAAMAVMTGNVWGQTDNLLQGWDGTGCETTNPKPSDFGWTSSESRTLNAENATGGIRFTTTYTNYKLSGGTSYTYSAGSTPSSKIFWIRYNKSGESFTYTTKPNKLEAGHTYKYSALVGWHNNSNAPKVTATIKAGDNKLAEVSTSISAKTTLYLAEKTFKVSDDVDATSLSVSFTCNQTGDCMIALSALSIVEVAPKEELKGSIDAFKVPETNVGGGAFQYPAGEIQGIKAALETAQGVYDDNDATIEAVNEQIGIVKALALPALNGPKENVRYKICVTADDFGSYIVKDHPITFVAGGQGTKDKTDTKNYDGYYSLTYEKAYDKNYGQAFLFVPVAGEADMYKISFTGEDGETCYMATQKGAGYKSSTDVARIRVTEDIDKALKFKVVATSEEGVWNLLNTESASQTPIGVNDYGVYTRTNRPGFAISETDQAQATLKVVTGVKYGTFIAPFKAEKPENVSLYSVEEVDGTTLTLVEAAEITANTPYIVYADAEETISETLTAYGTATKDGYQAGLLVGTLAGGEMTLGAGCYLLQKNNGVVGFYKCEDGKKYKLGANRAYLKYEAPAGVKAFFFGDENNETAITALSDLMNGKAEIYDLNGRKQQKLEKGVNIVNGKKVIIK